MPDIPNRWRFIGGAGCRVACRNRERTANLDDLKGFDNALHSSLRCREPPRGGPKGWGFKGPGGNESWGFQAVWLGNIMKMVRNRVVGTGIGCAFKGYDIDLTSAM